MRGSDLSAGLLDPRFPPGAGVGASDPWRHRRGAALPREWREEDDRLNLSGHGHLAGKLEDYE